MDLDKKNKWLDVYEDYLDDKYDRGNYEHLDIIIHNLVMELEHGIRTGKEVNLFMDEDAHDDIRVEFISKLKLLFTRIASNNRQNEVLDACKLFYHLRDNKSYIPDALELYFFPQDAYLRSPNSYNSIWNSIINNYIDNETYNHMDPKYFKAFTGNTKEILDLYQNYIDGIKLETMDDIRRRSIFKEYVNKIIAYFYKEKCDISLFPKVLDYIYEHAFDLNEFYELNIDEEEYDRMNEFNELMINRIMEDIINIRPNIL